MNFVSSTKAFIQKFRDEEWDNLLTTVKSFCEARDIDVPDTNARYVKRGGLARYQQDDFTIEHHYWVDIFYAAIDSILQELNHQFSKCQGRFCDKGQKCKNGPNLPLDSLKVFVYVESSPKFTM